MKANENLLGYNFACKSIISLEGKTFYCSNTYRPYAIKYVESRSLTREL